MSPTNDKTTISDATKVTIGLVLAIIGSVYYLGYRLGGVEQVVTSLVEIVKEIKSDISTEQRDKTSMMIKIGDLSSRVDALEKGK